LFKFFYPEVFRYVGWACNDADLPMWAALGHLLRRGTPLEMESENRFRVRYWNKVNSFATSFDEVLTEVRRISAPHAPHRLVPFSEENPVGFVRYGGWLVHYLQFNDPRAALMLFPGHYDYLRNSMSNHSKYKECHQAFELGLLPTKTAVRS
jgi:hypothetical protein